MSAPRNRACQPRHILAVQAAELQREGLNGLQIAAQLNVSKSYAYELLTDPTGELNRRRKRQYAGACVDCGAETNGYDGPGKASQRCVPCAQTYLRETYGIWSRERVIGAIHAWADEHGGVPPSATDWHPSLARAQGKPEKAEKFYADGAWPNVTTVVQYFGGWNEAIRAAGFEARPAGHYGRDGEDPEYAERVAEMYRGGMSSAQIADRLGISGNSVRYQLRKAGEPVRSLSEARRLQWQRSRAAA